MIHEFWEGRLIGAMDGLCHGPEAAVTARLCASILAEYAGEPLDEMVARCNGRLRGTRGVALSICTLYEKASAWSWIGVGDVSAVLLREGRSLRREREFLLTRGGVAGDFMPKPAVSTVSAAPGHVIILATDGARPDYSHGLDLMGTPRQIAERILDRHATGTEDSLALVVRYAGGLP